MTHPRMAVAGLVLAAMLLPVSGFATTLDLTFTYDPSRVELSERDGVLDVRVPGATRNFVPGHPDLPLIAERVALPEGMQIASVDVVELRTTPLRAGARIGAAVKLAPGLGLIERTAPDPDQFQRPGFRPDAPVLLGAQGGEEGVAVAYLQVAPVRWDPVRGDLEAVTRLRVRLTLAPADFEVLKRLRGAGIDRAASSVVAKRAPDVFKPTQIPSLLGSPVEYLIITNEEMVPEYQRLADWKTQSGVPAAVRTLSFIQQQYPFGADDAERIRTFIRDAYQRWGTKWVLLGGDTEVLPTRLAYTTFYGGEYIACDMYFSCLDGTWNADGDSLYGEGFQSSSNPGDAVDLLPEVYVGRAPTITAADAKHFVDRTMNYVRNPAGDYEKRVLFFAEVLFPQNWLPGMTTSLDGAELVEEVLPHLQFNPSIKFARLYENHLDARWMPGSIQETRQRVVDSLNVGYNIAVHVGHGFRNVMSCGDANLDNSHALGLTNGNRVSNLYAINCTSNAIDFPCIGEAFLMAKNGGAVTNVGSTRFDFPTAGRAYQSEYFRLLYRDSVTAVGELQARQKLPFIGFSTFDGVHRWTQQTLLLLGDPELRIYTGTPRTLTVTHPASVSASDTGFAVSVAIGATPLYNARVTAYRPGGELSRVVTDGAGNAWVPIRPDSAGSLTLTVTAFDSRPYQATVSITASGVAVFRDAAPVIVDDGSGGTVGNGNALLDVGETIDLRVALTNTGGAAANGVTGVLTTSDPYVTISQNTVNYGLLNPGGSANPAGGFRIVVPATTPDQHEVAFRLDIQDNGGGVHVETFQLVVHGPEPFHLSHTVVDVGGNSNARPDSGETVTYTVRLKNLGSGRAQGVTAVLRSLSGSTVISDSTASFGTIAPGAEASGDPFVFVPGSNADKLQLRVSDALAVRLVETIDFTYPAAPQGLKGIGAGTSVTLDWAKSPSSDLRGYNVYRSTSQGGPFTKVNSVPTARTAYYLNIGLSALTRYYYQVTAVDSSGNESTPSSVTSVSTNPPPHPIFPIPLAANTPAPVAFDHVYPGYPVAIGVGAQKLHVFHSDGSAPVDADGAGTTFGDFSTQGTYFAAGASIGDVDNDGIADWVAPTWTSKQLFVFNRDGTLKSGWPKALTHEVWSGAALGDLDNDGDMEIVLGSNGPNLFAFHHTGAELLDGDANPGTVGIFKVLGNSFNFGTPAIVDLDGNNVRDIVYGSYDGKLYAWRADGSNLPGFPVTLGGNITASVAVGYLDGPADTELDIVVPVKDSVFVIRANGARKAGWPKYMKIGGTSKAPSPALADMNNDGFLDVVQAGTDGTITAWDRNGAVVAPWSGLRYSTLTSFASESSPVVADIDGDGLNDVVIGDENATLNAIGGTGAVLPGFPIVLGSEVRGTAGVCDCDGDGLSEIVVSSWGGDVHMWDYPFPFSPGKIPPWPQFHHDARRTGYAGAPVLVDVGDPGAGGAPQRIEFAPPAPNPTRGLTRLWYAIPADRAGVPLELSVHDLAGRRVRTLERGTARAGRHSVEWDLRDARGRLSDAGIYFVRFAIGGEAHARKLVVTH